jgi:hypothetical protein
LKPGGAVVVNLIAARSGSRAAFGEAEYATYREQFGVVRMAPLSNDEPVRAAQNQILVAGQRGGRAEAVAAKLGMLGAAPPSARRALSDDFAPVEQMTGR